MNRRLISSVYVVMIYLRWTFKHPDHFSKWIRSHYYALFNEKLIESPAQDLCLCNSLLLSQTFYCPILCRSNICLFANEFHS